MATELQIMAHAKGYLDKLANGINPLTGEQLPETDIVNQVRISRCLFYVSDVLRQVIDRGGLQKRKAKQTPFCLSVDQLQRFEFSASPVPISAITERLNVLIEDDDMKKISHRNITNWLENEGYLIQSRDSQGKLKRWPTDQGRLLGIYTEDRIGMHGVYTVVLYPQQAQQFILDSLSKIIEMMNVSRNTPSDPDSCEVIDYETGEILKESSEN